MPSKKTLFLGHALLRNCRNICVQTGNHPRHGKSSSFRLRLSSVRTRPTPIPTSLSTATPRVVSGTDRVPGHSRAHDLGHSLFLIESLRSALSKVLMCKDVVSLERQIKPINRFDRQAVTFRGAHLGPSNSPPRSVRPSTSRASSRTRLRQPQKPPRDPCR
jgi:hypothetical protein